MSYPGGPAPGNGWAGPHSSNTLNRQDSRSIYAQQSPSTSTYQAPGNGAYYQQPYNGQPRAQYPMSTSMQYNHPHPAYPQYQNPPNQFVQPSQLYHQAPAQMGQLPSISRQIPTLAASSSTRMADTPATYQPDNTTLLLSLAEEYFDAAHELGPLVSLEMTGKSVGNYQKLVATGLGCLDAALRKGRLAPRMEATVRLRYAGVLHEETENTMEAETTLAKGIVLCDRNHFFDLKYAMQYLLAQVMAQKNPKAAMKALDGYIPEAEAYQHISWVYALRFLRARFAVESGSTADINAAVHNLQKIAELAARYQDRAIHLMASLMEAMVHMKSSGPDTVVNIQRAIAAANSHQLASGDDLPQLTGLALIIDVMCSIRGGSTHEMLNKLKSLQVMMDQLIKDPRWSNSKDRMAIPINRTPKTSQVVSHETRGVLGIGEDGRDNLMMSFLNKPDTLSVSYLLCGVVLLHKSPSDPKGLRFLGEGIRGLEGSSRSSKERASMLPESNLKQLWRGELLCYFRLYMAIYAASTSKWADLKSSIESLTSAAHEFNFPLKGPLACLTTYLTGAYYQGIGNFDTALRIFRDPAFALPASLPTISTSVSQISRDFAILAAFNSLWILQDPGRQNLEVNNALIAKLEPLCEHNPNKDLQTAFTIIKATVDTVPPTPLFELKRLLNNAMLGAKATSNQQFLCIAINVMCSRFFNNVVGEQAEKSAMAASVQAHKTGNVLWQSVSSGLLARCHEVQGKGQAALAAWSQAEQLAGIANGSTLQRQ